MSLRIKKAAMPSLLCYPAALDYDSLIGTLVAHESDRLVLLSLDPDTVHGLPLHEPHKTAIIQSCITASYTIITDYFKTDN